MDQLRGFNSAGVPLHGMGLTTHHGREKRATAMNIYIIINIIHHHVCVLAICEYPWYVPRGMSRP